MTKHTPTACLASIAITAAHIEGKESLDDEFRIIKKVYHEKILKEHPDKGGDPATFRETRAAFEVLRSLYQEGTVKEGTFTSYLGGAVDDDVDIDELYETYATSDSYPSYTYYAEAASTPVPSYRVEKAKSGRSRCQSRSGKNECGGTIVKDSIRVGSLDEKSGSFGRWHHLTSAERRNVGGVCRGWRVPKKVWSGLTRPSDPDQSLIDLLNMEEVLLCGLASLDGASQREFTWHCVQEENWAGHKRKAVEDGGKKGKKKSKTQSSDVDELVVANAAASTKVEEEVQKPAAAEASSGFALPNPEAVDTVESTFLSAHSFIITGNFPELVMTGATKAKDAGVGDVKVLIESFGGKVGSRFSKKTSYVIVGRDPSRSKFSDAETRQVPILTLNMLNAVLNGSHSFEAFESLPALDVESFEGAAYQPGGGVLPTVPANADTGTALVQLPAQKASKKKAAAKSTGEKNKATKKSSDDKKPAAKKTSVAKAKKEKKAPPPADRASMTVVQAALAAAAAGRNAHRAIESGAASSTASSTASSNAIVPAAASSSTSSTALVAAGGKVNFVIPKPGVNGAIAGVLNGKRFVLTGVFPEVGGGFGLTQGKDKTKQMIESFGGTVTSAVSGKTDYLLVGKEPGASKVGKAHKNGIPLLDLMSLQRLLLGQTLLENVADEPPPRIESFSSGYGGNGLICGE